MHYPGKPFIPILGYRDVFGGKSTPLQFLNHPYSVHTHDSVILKRRHSSLPIQLVEPAPSVNSD